jgi:hypothetical protein
MAINYASGAFTASGANTDADLKAVFDANPSNGMYEGGAAILKAASLSIPSGATVTTTTGTVFVFDDAAGYRMNLTTGGTLDFKFGGGITYNGNVQHSFFTGKLNGKNIVYRINATVANGRSDFFAPNTTSDGMEGLTLVFGGGADGYTVFTHLENLAGKITNLKFVNDITTSLGAAGSLNVQFGGGTYPGVIFPKVVSNYGITTALNIYLARSGGNSVLLNPTMYGTQLSLVGDVNGTAELIDEYWPDMAVGSVGSLGVLAYNGGNTAVSRKITWTPGTFVGWNVYIADSRVAPVVAQNGLISSPAGILLTWALFNRNPTAQTTYSPFRLTARKRGFVEQYKIFSPVQPIKESFLPEVDSYYTSDRSALGGISASAATKTLTIAAGTAITLDAINDWLDWWLEQPAQLASVPITFKANAGTAMSLGDWSIANAGTITTGTKLKSLAVTGAITGAGTMSVPYTDANQAGFIAVEGAQGNTVQLRKASDNSVIRSRTGDGVIAVAPADVSVSVYLARLSGGVVVASSVTTPKALATGDNGIVKLYAGDQVQVANLDRLPTLAQIEASTVLAKRDELAVINTGVKQASLLIPHTTDL